MKADDLAENQHKPSMVFTVGIRLQHCANSERIHAGISMLQISTRHGCCCLPGRHPHPVVVGVYFSGIGWACDHKPPVVNK